MTEFMKPSAYNVCYESGAAGEWRARAWRRRVKQVEVEPRGTVHRRYYCFVYEVFAPCTRVTTIRYQAPLVSFNPRGEKVPLLSFPSTNFRLFSSLFSPLLPLLPGEPTYFNKVDLFPRMRLFRLVSRAPRLKGIFTVTAMHTRTRDIMRLERFYAEGMVCIMGDLWRLPSMILGRNGGRDSERLSASLSTRYWTIDGEVWRIGNSWKYLLLGRIKFSNFIVDGFFASLNIVEFV